LNLAIVIKHSGLNLKKIIMIDLVTNLLNGTIL